jgi:hypothetical protein
MRLTAKIVSVAGLLWLVTASTIAQDIPSGTPLSAGVEEVERLLPVYSPCVVEGTRFACYTATQQLQLNLLEENARTWRNQLLLTEQLRLDQATLVQNLTTQLHESSEIITAERTRNEVLTAQLMTEIEEKNRYRAEADSVDWWPLLIGGVVGLLGAGVAIGVVIAAATGAFNTTVSTSP